MIYIILVINGKVPKDLVKELEDKYDKIKEEYEKYLGLKYSIFEFWDIFLPILNKLTLNEEYKKLLGNTNSESIDNLKFNLIDKVKAYKKYECIGDQEKSRIEENQFGKESNVTISRLGEILFELKSKYDREKTKTKILILLILMKHALPLKQINFLEEKKYLLVETNTLTL